MTHRGLIAQYKRILHFAAVDQYPKLFQNLRSTRQTELTRKHPAHIVCAWLGNSHKVALKHYLQVTDEDFEAAAAKVDHSPEKVDHIVDQHSQAPTRTELPGNAKSPGKSEALPNGAVRFRSVPVVKVGDTGIEPIHRSPFSGRTLEKSTLIGNQSAAHGAANRAENAPETADLGLLIAAWPKLPDEIRKKIVHIVQTVQ